MTGQGHALIAVIVLGFCCLGAIAIDESLSGEQQSTAETGHRDESPHTVHFVTVDSNIKLEVLDWGGSGRAIVLLAGLGNTAHVFDDFAPKLTGTYHVYGITRRGFGNSSSPRGTPKNYSADRLGDDVFAVIRSLGLKRPVLVGHSIAGEELSDIGTRHPELRDKLDELIPGRETTDRKHVYEDLLVMLPRFENELHVHQQELRTVPEPLESAMPKIEEEIVAGERRFAGTTVPTLAIFAFPHDLGSAFKNNPIAQAAAEKADQSWTGAQIRFIESKYPSIRLVCIPHASHFVFQSNEADVLHDMSFFIHGLNVEKASATTIRGRAVR